MKIVIVSSFLVCNLLVTILTAGSSSPVAPEPTTINPKRSAPHDKDERGPRTTRPPVIPVPTFLPTFRPSRFTVPPEPTSKPHLAARKKPVSRRHRGPTYSPISANQGANPLLQRLVSLIDGVAGCPTAAIDVSLNSNTYQGKAATYVDSLVTNNAVVLSDAKLVQYYALACIYYATGGDSSWQVNFNWLSTTFDPCDNVNGWIGVTCDATLLITQLNSYGLGLTGTYPCEVNLLSSDHPSKAGSLEYLDISSNSNLNSAGSSGPQWLTGLGNSMTQLDFSFTTFNTTIPSNFGTKLLNLNVLGMTQAGVAGDLSFLNGLTQVASLFLATNNFVGTIPTFLGDFTSLGFVFLSHNDLAGPLPTELGLLTDMVTFAAPANKLTGTLPIEFASLTSKLGSLFLYSNLLVGSIPSEYGSLSLSNFEVENNHLVGSVPLSICSFPHIGVDCDPLAIFSVTCGLCTCCCSLADCGSI